MQLTHFTGAVASLADWGKMTSAARSLALVSPRRRELMFLRIGRHEGDQDSLTGLFAPVGQAFQPVRVESRRALNRGRFTNRPYDAALHSGQAHSITRACSASFFTLVLVRAVREPPVASGARPTARVRVFCIRQRAQSEKHINPARDCFFSTLRALAAGLAVLAVTASGCTSNQSAQNAQAAAAD